MTTYVPFTYFLYHIPTGKKYYGVRYARGCHPNDLWTTYFTSSKHVKKLIKQYGKDSFIPQVRRTFNDKSKARQWECVVLKRMNVVSKEDWINCTDNMSVTMPDGFKHSDETRAKMSASKKGKPSHRKNKKLSEKHREAIQKAMIDYGPKRRGFKHSPETIEKMRKNRSGKAPWNKGLKKSVHPEPSSIQDNQLKNAQDLVL